MKPAQEIVLAHRNELCGMIADAATRGAKGGELALLLRTWFTRVDHELLKVIEEARRDPPAPPAQPPGAKK
jgi:hypothetical protein